MREYLYHVFSFLIFHWFQIKIHSNFDQKISNRNKLNHISENLKWLTSNFQNISNVEVIIPL